MNKHKLSADGVRASLYATTAMVVFLLSALPAVAQLPDFTGLVQKTSGVVVNISTRGKSAPSTQLPEIPVPPIPKDSPWYEFWEKFFGEQQKMPERAPSSEGSGFIISSDGYIVTNYHVINNAEKIIVRFRDRRELRAELVGHDTLTDLALLKVEAKDLPVANLGNSKTLEAGQWVVAIGAPFGFEYSVTAGIISATNRILPWESHVPFIQTDVATNPGNSGGPLMNLKGEVIGINSQIYSRTGSFSGLAFAIPIEFAMNAIEQIKSDGQVSHGWLGVYVQEVTHELSKSFGLDRPRGALIADVIEDSPAEKAELRSGDIILKFADTDINSSGGLPHVVGMAMAGDEKPMVILRDGEKIDISVTLGEIPRSYLKKGPVAKASDIILGMRISEIPIDNAEGYEPGTPGLLVEEVVGENAGNAGVQKGDIIIEVAGERLRSIEQFKSLAAKLPENLFTALRVLRDGKERVIPLHVPKNE